MLAGPLVVLRRSVTLQLTAFSFCLTKISNSLNQLDNRSCCRWQDGWHNSHDSQPQCFLPWLKWLLRIQECKGCFGWISPSSRLVVWAYHVASLWESVALPIPGVPIGGSGGCSSASATRPRNTWFPFSSCTRWSFSESPQMTASLRKFLESAISKMREPWPTARTRSDSSINMYVLTGKISGRSQITLPTESSQICGWHFLNWHLISWLVNRWILCLLVNALGTSWIPQHLFVHDSCSMRAICQLLDPFQLTWSWNWTSRRSSNLFITIAKFPFTVLLFLSNVANLSDIEGSGMWPCTELLDQPVGPLDHLLYECITSWWFSTSIASWGGCSNAWATCCNTLICCRKTPPGDCCSQFSCICMVCSGSWRGSVQPVLDGLLLAISFLTNHLW